MWAVKARPSPVSCHFLSFLWLFCFYLVTNFWFVQLILLRIIEDVVAQNPESEVKEIVEDIKVEKKAHKKNSKKSKKSKREHKHDLDDDLADIGGEKSTKELQREIAVIEA